MHSRYEGPITVRIGGVKSMPCVLEGERRLLKKKWGAEAEEEAGYY